VIRRARDDSGHSLICFRRRAGDEEVVSAADQPFGDGSHLTWSLPLPEHDFGEPLARGSMVVDARESEVFEWALAQNLKEAVMRRLRCNFTAAHLVEKGP
jgi:hypothetical protein